jgi:hypothetical protein
VVKDTKPDAEKALREAWAAIAAMLIHGVDCGRTVVCVHRQAAESAIDRAVRAAWEAGFANGMQTSAHALDNTPPPDDPDWLPKEES